MCIIFNLILSSKVLFYIYNKSICFVLIHQFYGSIYVFSIHIYEYEYEYLYVCYILILSTVPFNFFYM